MNRNTFGHDDHGDDGQPTQIRGSLKQRLFHCADHSRDNSRAGVSRNDSRARDSRNEPRADDDSRNEPSTYVDSRNGLCVEVDFQRDDETFLDVRNDVTFLDVQTDGVTLPVPSSSSSFS